MPELTSGPLLLTWQPLMSISRTLALLSSACSATKSGSQQVLHVAGHVWHTQAKHTGGNTDES